MNSKTNIKRKSKRSVKFPASLLLPVGKFLQEKLVILEKRKSEIDKDDPFKFASRAVEYASPDTSAYEQFGHARSSALKTEVDRKIIQTPWQG